MKGLEKLLGLEKIDLTENVLIEMEDVLYLSELPFLKAVTLLGNPVAMTSDYRKKVYCYLNNERVILDGKLASSSEIEALKKFQKTTSTSIKVRLSPLLSFIA